MRTLDRSRWKPAKNYPEHDRLMLEYCKRHGGTTFANAKLDGDPFSYPRRIDGIRFLSPYHRLISWSRHGPKEFQEHLLRAQRNRLPVEVIEVTQEIGRYTVGQVVVAGWLLEHHKVKEVLVCQEAERKLEAFFRSHDIVLWTPD